MKSLLQWLRRLLAAGFLSALPLSAATVTATFTAPTTVLVTAASYTATGNTVNFTLNFAPAVGTDLTVVKNTGLGFIQGTFDNLAQGQTVTLSRSGIHYAFVANYFGGTGNDLVLQWANTRVLKWPFYTTGDNSAIPYGIPLPMDMTGMLAGKTIRTMAVGAGHYLALCTDGTLAAWGANSAGQLGNNASASSSSVPVGVDTSGVLAGKTIIAIAAGNNHSMALCSDGTLAAWGYNSPGSLGNGSMASSKVPVLVDRSGVLAGKAIIAMAAGESHSLALCSDGTVAAWGENAWGQLGDNTLTDRNVPVAVNTTGVLAGKTVTAIGASGAQSLALCSDGTVVSWGANARGQLGNNSTTQSSVPVLVDRTGVLSGKTVSAIAASDAHNLALCSDGTLAAWGYNYYGQLGNNSTIKSGAADSSVPVLVDTSDVLAGKTITDIHAAQGVRSFALCSDGTLAGWGYNSDGSLGAFTKAHSSVPLAVSMGSLKSGERFVDFLGGEATSFALVASPPLPVASTLAATGMLDTAATLNGSVIANGSRTTVSFEYGLTTAYGTTISATPAATTGTTATAEQATPAGLLAGTTYHYRVVATSAGGTVTGEDMSFTTSTTATLAGLSLSGGTLAPGFSSSIVDYSSVVPNAASSITVTPIAAFATSTVKVNNVTVASGAASTPINLAVGNNTITIVVSAAGGANTLPYTVTVTRLPAVFTFNSATTVPVAVDDFVATGKTANYTLNFAPLVGTNLTVVNNTGSDFIHGTFDNLTQGQRVQMTYGGITYAFVANYFGGTGNDLVLHWANTRLLAWGPNSYGQLGNNSTLQSTVPTPVDMTGVLAGRTITATAVGSSHALVLCADGTLAAWGNNAGGQLGNNSTTNSSVPVLVDRTGVLADRAIVAISAGSNHNLVLCADGTLVIWGTNPSGLGNTTTTSSKVPILVDQTGVLAGKTVIAVSASGHDLVVCSDGSVATWGANSYGQLGNDSITDSLVPVLVNTAGVLAGKKVVAGNAASSFSLVRCADGTLVTWGTNSDGQLGNRISGRSRVPVLVDMSGMLYGKTIIAMGTASHCLVLCSDGTLSSWGINQYGQLGYQNYSAFAISNSYYPLLVDTSGVLAGKTVVAIAEGGNQALCADGTLVAWGYNSYGQLGNNSTSDARLPVLVNTTALRAGERFVAGVSGKVFASSLVLVAAPPPPIALTLAATGTVDTGATLNGNVNANGSSTAVTFEYGLTTAYGSTVTATPSPVTGTDVKTVSYVLGGLSAGTTYHYRVIATSVGGSSRGADMTFTTTTFASLADLIEYAFGLHSNSNGTGQLPQPQRIGDKLVMGFTQPEGVTGITYGAEWSTNLLPGSWTDVPDTGSGTEHIFSVPAGTAPRLFMRLKVTSQ